MTKQVQRRRGTATQHTSFTGAEGELSVNTTNKSVHVHDNVTAGGFEAARADMDNVTSSSILTAAGITATTAELNYVDGVTSNIQTQLDGKAGTASPTFTGTLTTANLTATGTTTLAGASTSADITFGDNDKAIFGGTTSELQIYSDGSNSYVTDQGTGSLRLRGVDIQMQNTSGVNYAKFVSGADVQLFYSGAPKLATTSSGVDITGVLSSDGLTVETASGSISATDTSLEELVVNSSGYTSIAIHSDRNTAGQTLGSFAAYGKDSASSDVLYGRMAFEIEANTAGVHDGSIKFQTVSDAVPKTRLNIDDGGDISFYEDTGTTPKFFWDASAESLGIGTDSPSSALHVSGSGAEEIRITRTGGAGRTYSTSVGGSLEYNIRDENAGVNRLSISTAGNVGIGVSNPSDYYSTKLVVDAEGGEDGITIASTTAAEAYLMFADGTSGDARYRGFVGYNHSSDSLRFATTGSERMRILSDGSCRWTPDGTNPDMTLDASGNLLVGTTTVTLSDATSGSGIALQADGQLEIARAGTGSSDVCARFNRSTGDGAIVEFRKSGASVGSIGSVAGAYMALGKGNTGLLFQDGLNEITPYDISDGANEDAAINLGKSNARWKDLYLSGTIEIENGSGNVGVGKQALNSNTSNHNTAVGYRAAYTTSSGSANTALGMQALYTNSSGSNNTSVGLNSMYFNVSGSNNTAIGRDALHSNTASNNTAVGYQAGYNSANSDSTFIGISAGYSASYAGTGRNTFIGYDAGSAVTDGRYNTILGSYNGNQGGLDIRTSSNNIVLADGDGNPRGRFDANGKFYVRTGNDQGIEVRIGSTTATNGKAIDFIDGDDNNCGTIRINASANTVTYNTSSDHRLKENVVELTGATTRLKQLEPKRFNFISDPDDITVDGFLAHEVQTVVPEAITGTHNEVDEDSNPVYQQIDQSKLVPLLVATIKELEARITALENA